VAAVADELIIAHPEGHTATATAAVALGGPMLFLAGHALFKWVLSGQFPRSRFIAIGVLALLFPVGLEVSPLALGGMATAVVVAFAAWDTWAYHRMPHAVPAEGD
jgi:low temperature requirement protein LtrA